MTRVLITETVHDENGVTYEPWVGGDGSVGYRIWHPNGEVEYVYLTASQSDSEGQSNVFLYRGAEGSPDQDEPQHHYVITKEDK